MEVFGRELTTEQVIGFVKTNASNTLICEECRECLVTNAALELADTIQSLQAELERVKAEKDAMLVELKKAADDNGHCYGCKHLDEATEKCKHDEYRVSCNAETNNRWEWRGLTTNTETED